MTIQKLKIEIFISCAPELSSGTTSPIERPIERRAQNAAEPSHPQSNLPVINTDHVAISGYDIMQEDQCV